jgi:Flp pilus assembly protein TadG
MTRAGKRGGGDQGSATVEVTLAMPLLGLLLLLIVQFAFWAHANHVAQAAANQGVQNARAYGSTEGGGVEVTNAILDQTAGSVLGNRSVTVTNTATTSTVTVTGRVASVVPGLSLPITVRVTAPRELVPGMP